LTFEQDPKRHGKRSRIKQLSAVLALAGALVTWQLFIPPIIGLADQGDFLRVLGPLGYAPVPKGPEHKYWYLTRTYIQDPSYREPRWEQITSEMIPARIAISVHNLFGNPNAFDITVFGLMHALIFLLALARLLYVTRDLTMYRTVWAFILLVTTDVGYVAYWNSLYTEPASCLWFLFLLAEGINLCKGHQVSVGSVLRWNVFAVLLITAKAQNAALCIPLAAYGVASAWRSLDRKVHYAALLGSISVCLAGVSMYLSVPATTRVTAIYNVIFFAILPDSPDARSDLQALGLNPDYAQYSGTVAWSLGTGVADGALVNALQANVSSFRLIEFYLRRPGRMWRRLEVLLPSSVSLRPEFCGNFDKSAGRLPGARSEAVALWSSFHKRCLSRIAALLIGALIVTVVGGGLVLLFHSRRTASVRRFPELGICLAACCLTAFFVAAFGDAWDNVKHQFLFNLLLDTCLVFLFVAALESSSCFTVLKGTRGSISAYFTRG
jgi:hypothetical protein